MDARDKTGKSPKYKKPLSSAQATQIIIKDNKMFLVLSLKKKKRGHFLIMYM